MGDITDNKNLAIYNFLEQQMQLFKGHFLITQASMDEDAIHQMRVAIKRIKTIQRLKKHINFPSIIDKEQYKSIKTIFDVSGNLRDLQIQQTLLARYSVRLGFSFVELSEYLIKMNNEFSVNLNTSIKETDLNRFEEMQNTEDELNDVDIKTDLERESLVFLQNKIKIIQKLIYIIDKDENVHELRKQLKQLFFILEFMHVHFPENKVSASGLKKFKLLGEKIGNWNDREVFKAMLGNFLNGKPEDYLIENSEYKILNYILEEEKRIYLSELDVDLYLEIMVLKSLIESDKVNDNPAFKISAENINPAAGE